MRLATVAMLTLLVACAPPKIELADDSGGISGDPSIQIIHPTDQQAVELNADCSLTLMVAVDVDNIDIVPPGELVDGEGHWHVVLENIDNNYTPVPDQFYVMERPPSALLVPGPATISATLTNSQHVDLEVNGEPVLSIAEFTLAAPAGVTCP